MKAFSCKFEKIYMSIMYDTITFYASEKSMLEEDSIKSHDRPLSIISNIFRDSEEFKTVYRNDIDHSRYHSDDMNRNNNHIHKKYDKPIDESAFQGLLGLLCGYHIITEEEKNNALPLYDQANSLVIDFINPTNEEIIFNNALLQFYFKVCDLSYHLETDINYNLVANKAYEVYQTIYDAMFAYSQDKNANSYNIFRTKCQNVINDAYSVFKQHRGYKNQIASLILAVGTIGLGYAAAVIVSRSFTLFKTDTIEKTLPLIKAINDIPKP